MSETKEGSSAEVETEQEIVETSPAVEAKVEELFEVHGKKFPGIRFDNPEIKGQLKGFLEAMSSELGRKNNEVGTLRKFVAAQKPDETEENVIKQARAKAQDGDIDAALDAVFGYSKAKIRELEQKQADERENSETWDAYLSSRPELTKLFDKKTVRRVSEAELNIYEQNDPFGVLDSFWMPKTKLVTTVEAASQAPKKKDTPPVTLSGGQASAAKSAPASKSTVSGEKVDLFSIFDSISKPKRS